MCVVECDFLHVGMKFCSGGGGWWWWKAATLWLLQDWGGLCFMKGSVNVLEKCYIPELLFEKKRSVFLSTFGAAA